MQNKHVKGIIGMTFLNQRNLEVKKATMNFSALSPIILPALTIGAKTPFSDLLLPMSLVSKMSKLSNDRKALKIMLKDKSSAGNFMSIKFLNSYMQYTPPYHVSAFVQCPILLTQPAADRWTPLEMSQQVMQRLTVPHQTVMLPQGGHYPVEKPALDQLLKSSIQFIQQNLN